MRGHSRRSLWTGQRRQGKQVELRGLSRSDVGALATRWRNSLRAPLSASKVMMEAIQLPRRGVGGISLSQTSVANLGRQVLMGSEVCLKNNEWEDELRITEEFHFACRPDLLKHANVLQD